LDYPRPGNARPGVPLKEFSRQRWVGLDFVTRNTTMITCQRLTRRGNSERHPTSASPSPPFGKAFRPPPARNEEKRFSNARELGVLQNPKGRVHLLQATNPVEVTMFGELLQPMHLLLILVIALLLFGPGKLPQIAANMGKSIREFKSALSAPEEVKVSAPPQQQAEAQPAQPTAAKAEAPKQEQKSA